MTQLDGVGTIRTKEQPMAGRQWIASFINKRSGATAVVSSGYLQARKRRSMSIMRASGAYA